MPLVLHWFKVYKNGEYYVRSQGVNPKNAIRNALRFDYGDNAREITRQLLKNKYTAYKI